MILRLYADESGDEVTGIFRIAGYLMTHKQWKDLDKRIGNALGPLDWFHMKDGGLEARRKPSAIGKLNLDVGTIMPVLKDGEKTNGLVGEFFAFDHGVGLRAGRISHL